MRDRQGSVTNIVVVESRRGMVAEQAVVVAGKSVRGIGQGGWRGLEKGSGAKREGRSREKEQAAQEQDKPGVGNRHFENRWKAERA